MKGTKAQGWDVKTRKLSYRYPTLVQVRPGFEDLNALVANRTFNLLRVCVAHKEMHECVIS